MAGLCRKTIVAPLRPQGKDGIPCPACRTASKRRMSPAVGPDSGPQSPREVMSGA
jgi:hypothetical protein